MPIPGLNQTASGPGVDIVICAHNNKKITEQCLESILASTYRNYKIILADDCSTDDSVPYFKEKYPDIAIIQNQKNLGTAKTRNKGINAGNNKYIVTMDNDAVISADWLEKMVALLEQDDELGQAGGKILLFSNPQLIAAAGGSMHFRGKGYDIGSFEPDIGQYDKPRPVLYVCSSSMITRRDILDKIGGFCDLYYHGYEDTDYSLKVNIAGYKVVYYPKAISRHMLSETVKKTIGKKQFYLWTRGRLLIMLRNYQWPSLIKYLPSNIRFTLSEGRHHPEYILSIILSWLWILLNFTGILKQRHAINRLRKISDQQMFKLFNLE